MIYYRRYIGAYQKRTTRLSMRDHGAYALMLDFYYAEEQPLPLEMEDIYDICKARTPDDRKSVQKVLRLHFERRDDGYHNARADAEIAASRQARANGKKGGRPPSEETGEETGPGTGPKTGGGTGIGTEKGAGMGHPSTFNHSAVQPSAAQPPPDSRQPPSNPSAPGSSPRAPRKRATGEAKTNAVWAAYSAAYGVRWGVQPVRNASINGKLSNFVSRIPAAEAPEVAAFYVGSNRGLYVSAKHAVDLLVRDAESLRTEWATGRSGTHTEAMLADRTQATGNAFGKLIAEAEERERRGRE